MKNIILLFIIIFFTACNQKIYQHSYSADITKKELKANISYLASDELKGRKPGTKGGKMAAEYILQCFQNAGLKLVANNGFQYFDVVTDAIQTKGNTYLFKRFSGTANKDFAPFPFSASKNLRSEVVFVGYGFQINTKEFRWDDYKDVDAKGKWVLVMRGNPEPKKQQSKFAAYSNLMTKVRTALDNEAAGILFVTPETIDKQDELVNMKSLIHISPVKIPIINITRKLADDLLHQKNVSLSAIEQKIIRLGKSISFMLPLVVNATAAIELKKSKTQNVIALLEGNDPKLKNEYIVIGGHYDHLGYGGENSNSRRPDEHAIHNGADDNASGVAAVMELAEKFAANKKDLKRSIIFIAFGAEEMGLLGSSYYINNPLFSLKNTIAMFNFDMVGRLHKTKKTLTVFGSKTGKENEDILESYAKDRDFILKFSPDGYGPSDHAMFYSENIPVFFFSTGVHDDYHTPDDDANRINYKGEKIVLDYAYDVILDVINRDTPLTFQRSGSKYKGRRSGRLKVTFGIIPSYASDNNDGLLVDGVRKDRPAYYGGMKKGDKIVSVNGKAVGNIYDYMYRLKELNPGETVNVEVMRNGKKKILILQL